MWERMFVIEPTQNLYPEHKKSFIQSIRRPHKKIRKILDVFFIIKDIQKETSM